MTHEKLISDKQRMTAMAEPSQQRPIARSAYGAEPTAAGSKEIGLFAAEPPVEAGASRTVAALDMTRISHAARRVA